MATTTDGTGDKLGPLSSENGAVAALTERDRELQRQGRYEFVLGKARAWLAADLPDFRPPEGESCITMLDFVGDARYLVGRLVDILTEEAGQ